MPTQPADPTPPEVDTDGAVTAPKAAPKAAEPVEDPPTPPEWHNWAYNGPDRIYSQIPITATTGTILRWHHNPGLDDGCWTTTDNEPNTLPDNWRPEPTEAEAAKLRGDDDTSKEG